MATTASIVNATLLATVILLAALGQAACQGRPADEYYDEETYYDDKVADGSADFSADLTYAQYEQVTVKASPISSSTPQPETKNLEKAAAKVPSKVTAKVPAKISAKVPPKARARITLNAPTIVVPTKVTAKIPDAVPTKVSINVTSKVPAKVPAKVTAKVPAKVLANVPAKVPVKVPVDVRVNTPAMVSSTSPVSKNVSKLSTRSVHAAMQQLFTTSSTMASPTEKPWSEPTAARVDVLDTCRVLRSEAWLQVGLHTDCVQLMHVRVWNRRRGRQLFLRQFRLASRTTQLLWRRLLPLMPEEHRKNFQGCNMTYVSRTAKFCDRNLENAKEAAQIVSDDEYPHSPGRGWQMVCRLVKEYRYCMSELLAGCRSIGEEISRAVMVNVRAEGFNFCFAGGARCAATAPWAVALAPVALWNRAAQRP